MKNFKIKALCMILAFSLLSCFVPVFADNTKSEQKTEVNYAQNENASYAYLSEENWLSSFGDEYTALLNDGKIPYKETPFETVIFSGTSSVVSVVFDLGNVYSDIREIRFCGVRDTYTSNIESANRGFCDDKAIFNFSEDGVSYSRNNDFVIIKENYSEDGSETGYYNYIYRFEENVKARAVKLYFWSPVYLLSLGEIQIIGNGDEAVFPEMSEPDVSEPVVSEPDVSGDSEMIIIGDEANGISWTFYTESGRMEFYGDGDIPKSNNSNWGQYKDDIKGIYVGDGITSIESFEGHTGIKFIQLGKALSNEFSFADCVNLNKVIINSEIERINDYAFRGCSSLEILLFPDSLKSIGSYAFSGCEKLKDVYLPSNLEVIESFAFSDCVSIEKVVIPETVKELHWGAFISCSSLSEINIPKNIEFIESTFIAYTAIYNDKSNWTDGLLYIDNILVDTEEYSSESEYIVKEGTERIASSAFLECSELEKVSIPDSVMYIGSNAFGYCPNLKEVNLPTSLKEISDYLFSGCEALEKIILPENIEKIGESAFSYCSSLTEIIIPEKVKTVEKYAFENCIMLSKITINGALESLGSKAFYETPIMNEENYENGALYIDGILVDVLENEASGEFEIKEGTYLLGNGAISYCEKVTNVIIPDTVKYIGDKCFFGCKGLRTLYIPKTVEKIGEEIFESAYEYIVIKGELNSVSHRYSVENGIPFSSIDENFEYNVDFENNLLPNITEKKTLEEIISALGSIKALDKKGNIIEDKKAFLGTGSVVIYPNGYTATIVVKGDVDGTAFINSTDYLIIKKCFLKEYEIEGVFAIAADVYSDGIINSTDYLRIKKHFLKKDL